MSENPRAFGSGLSVAGEERRTRMLLELQGAMKRRVVRRRALRRAGGVALVAFVAAAVVVPLSLQRPKPPSVATSAGGSDSGTILGTGEALPRLAHVQLVGAPARSIGSAQVLETDAARMARYVAAPARPLSVEVVSDEDLMRALARTGNEYGLTRVGEKARLRCYSCDEGEAPWERVVPAPDDPGLQEH